MKHTITFDAFELEIEFDYNPGDPGRTSGPPENCYPPEGEEFEITAAIMIEGRWRLDVTSLIVSELCDGAMEWIEEKCIKAWRARLDEPDYPD